MALLYTLSPLTISVKLTSCTFTKMVWFKNGFLSDKLWNQFYCLGLWIFYDLKHNLITVSHKAQPHWMIFPVSPLYFSCEEFELQMQIYFYLYLFLFFNSDCQSSAAWQLYIFHTCACTDTVSVIYFTAWDCRKKSVDKLIYVCKWS